MTCSTGSHHFCLTYGSLYVSKMSFWKRWFSPDAYVFKYHCVREGEFELCHPFASLSFQDWSSRMIQRSNDIEKIKCNIIHDLDDVLTFDILHLYINVASFVFICDIILASISCTSAAPFTQTKKRVPRCGKMPRPMTVDPKASGVKLLNFPMDEWMNDSWRQKCPE